MSWLGTGDGTGNQSKVSDSTFDTRLNRSSSLRTTIQYRESFCSRWSLGPGFQFFWVNFFVWYEFSKFARLDRRRTQSPPLLQYWIAYNQFWDCFSGFHPRKYCGKGRSSQFQHAELSFLPYLLCFVRSNPTPVPKGLRYYYSLWYFTWGGIWSMEDLTVCCLSSWSKLSKQEPWLPWSYQYGSWMSSSIGEGYDDRTSSHLK